MLKQYYDAATAKAAAPMLREEKAAWEKEQKLKKQSQEHLRKIFRAMRGVLDAERKERAKLRADFIKQIRKLEKKEQREAAVEEKKSKKKDKKAVSKASSRPGKRKATSPSSAKPLLANKQAKHSATKEQEHEEQEEEEEEQEQEMRRVIAVIVGTVPAPGGTIQVPVAWREESSPMRKEEHWAA